MAFWTRLFGGKESDEPPSMPWDRRPSILEFVRTHICADRPGMAEDGYTLPDDECVNAGSKIRWGMGSMDGVMTHHFGTGENEATVRRTVELVLAYSRQPTANNKAAVYQHVIAEHVVSIIDPVIEALVNENGIGHDRLYELARSFVTEAPDREPVKFGIALLGLFRQPADIDLLQTLGRHDEFTLFCAVAITNASEDHDEALWTLARNVTGWGRIHTVERLARTTVPAIKRWMLREGFRNSIMYEYLAATCARTGGLLAALSEDRVDQELLTAAGDIIQALIVGGSAEGIDDYEDARPVIESYLGQRERVPEGKLGRRPGPARILPLGFAWQPEGPSVALAKALAEFLAIKPTHLIDGQVRIASVPGWVLPHHDSPLRLRHQETTHVEQARNPHEMLGRFGRVLLGARRTHQELTGRHQD